MYVHTDRRRLRFGGIWYVCTLMKADMSFAAKYKVGCFDMTLECRSACMLFRIGMLLYVQ